MFHSIRRWLTRGNRTPTPERPRRRLTVETLEARTPASSLLGLGLGNNTLYRFDSNSPGNILATTSITGIGSDTIRAIAFRPATGALYGLGIDNANTTAHLYIINPVTGATRELAGAASGLAAGSSWGMSFDPTSDLIRIVNAAGENARLDPLTGNRADTPNDTNLAFPSAVANVDLANDRAFPGSTASTLFGATTGTGTPNFSANLVRIGGVDGNPSANGGSVATVGQMLDGTALQSGENYIGSLAFTARNQLFASFAFTGNRPGSMSSELYTVNPTNGATSPQGTIGSGVTIDGLAAVNPTRLVTASQVGGDVRVMDGDGVTGLLLPFGPSVNIQIRAATGDVTRDGVPDIVVGTGPGGSFNQVKVFDGVTLKQVGPTIQPFVSVPAVAYQGVEVASGDVNGDGFADIIVGMGNGVAGQQNALVEVYSGKDFSLMQTINPFTSFWGGVRVGTVDQNGDGIQEVLVGSGLLVPPPGVNAPYGHVKAFDLSSGGLAETRSFLTFNGFFGGIFVAGGDVNGDGLGDIAVSSGFDADHVKIFSATAPNGVVFPPEMDSFFTFSGQVKGVRVGLADFNQDGILDVFVHQSQETAVPGLIIPQTLTRPSELRVFVLPQDGGLFGTNVAPTAAMAVYGGNIGASVSGTRF